MKLKKCVFEYIMCCWYTFSILFMVGKRGCSYKVGLLKLCPPRRLVGDLTSPVASIGMVNLIV